MTMTLGEFRAWLRGYLAAGGEDLDTVLDALAEVRDEPKLVTKPPVPTILPDPLTPTYPKKWYEVT